MERDDILRRYTTLPALIDVLVRKKITLLSFNNWVDANDRRALQLYQAHLHYGFVGAMCLTQAAETFHHWRVFAGGLSGVCIVFDRQAFEDLFRTRQHVIAKAVEYVPLSEIQRLEADDIHRLPFLKRWGFRDEKEFRLLGYAVERVNSMTVDITPDIVQRVIFSPFCHPNLVDSSSFALRKIDGWSDLRIDHSSLTDNQAWQQALSGFVERHGIVYSPWLELEGSLTDEGDRAVRPPANT